MLEAYAATQVRLRAKTSVTPSGHLNLVTTHELQEMRSALARGSLPPDLLSKLSRLAEGSLIHRYIAQNSRLCFALLLAALEAAFTEATPADRERLLRVLAYVRKDDDAIPDYQPSGFADDQQEVLAAATELRPLLESFKAWRLRYQVPAMWRGEQPGGRASHTPFAPSRPRC